MCNANSITDLCITIKLFMIDLYHFILSNQGKVIYFDHEKMWNYGTADILK